MGVGGRDLVDDDNCNDAANNGAEGGSDEDDDDDDDQEDADDGAPAAAAVALAVSAVPAVPTPASTARAAVSAIRTACRGSPTVSDAAVAEAAVRVWAVPRTSSDVLNYYL